MRRCVLFLLCRLFFAAISCAVEQHCRYLLDDKTNSLVECVALVRFFDQTVKVIGLTVEFRVHTFAFILTYCRAEIGPKQSDDQKEKLFSVTFCYKKRLNSAIEIYSSSDLICSGNLYDCFFFYQRQIYGDRTSEQKFKFVSCPRKKIPAVNICYRDKVFCRGNILHL